MAKKVWVVFDSELNVVIGVFDNAEAADDCQSAAPGDRVCSEHDLQKNYDEEEDDRFFNEEDAFVDDESMRESYDDDTFIDPGSEDDRDPYGD